MLGGVRVTVGKVQACVCVQSLVGRFPRNEKGKTEIREKSHRGRALAWADNERCRHRIWTSLTFLPDRSTRLVDAQVERLTTVIGQDQLQISTLAYHYTGRDHTTKCSNYEVTVTLDLYPDHRLQGGSTEQLFKRGTVMRASDPIGVTFGRSHAQFETCDQSTFEYGTLRKA